MIAPRLLGDITTILYAGVIDGLWFVEEGNEASVWVQGPFMPIGKVDAIIWLVALLTVLYTLSLLFGYMSNKLMARIASNMVGYIRSDIDQKMHRMKLNYYDTHTNGEILSTVTNDVDAINTLLGKNFYMVISAVITMIGVVVMLLTINGWLTLVAVALIPATFISTGFIMKRG